MIWYYDLLLMLGLTIASLSVFLLKQPKPAKTMAETKDGYKVTVKQMLDLESKRALGEPVLQRKVSGDDISELMLVMFGFGMFVSYLMVGNIIDHFFPIPNEVFGCAFILVFFTLFHFGLKTNVQTGLNFIKELTIEAPVELKQYGAYVKNPFDVHTTISKMKEAEEEWEVRKTRRDKNWLEWKEKPTKGGSDWLKKLDKDLEVVSKRITVQAGLLATSLMTDNPSDDIRSIIEANQKPDLARATKSVPHYIGVMKEIALNPDLPVDVRKEAQELVDTYQNKEVEREKQKVINEALLEIETVKKHIA